jgi:TPP-dependent pyruvate/acetoin dehydrogenase alpha subunit
VGAALSFRLRNLPFVGVACFGDGAVEQGVFHECLNLASVQGLPVLFVCENNFFATLSHVESRQTIPILDRAKIYGMPCIQTTGDDLLGVYDAASELLRGIRGGHGPAFLEVQAYRWMSHVGTEFDTGKMRRTQRELDGWRARCPLHVAERQLMEMGVASTEVEAVRRRVESELETAMAFALESAEPSRDAMWDDLGARGQS